MPRSAPPWVGIGYRPALAGWIRRGPPGIGCLEITAEHFFDGGGPALAALRGKYPLLVHGLGLSLGTPGPLYGHALRQFAAVVRQADPEWISEHVAFTRTDKVDLGHLNPLPPTGETLGVLTDHAREVAEVCGKPLILENISSHLRLPGELSQTEFLNRLCEQAGCGLLLDVTNLFIDSQNHKFDPRAWLREIEPAHITQLHIVGYSRRGEMWHDYHSENMQDDLLELLDETLAYARPRAVILERDGGFPPAVELERELAKLEERLAPYRPDHRAGWPAE